MQPVRWDGAIVMGLLVALGACGGTDAQPTDATVEADTFQENGQDVVAPFELPPRDPSWGVTLDPPELERVLAEERWVLPFLAADGVTGHRFPGVARGLNTVDMAAFDDRVYVVTQGLRPRNDQWQHIHAVSADGELLWSVEGVQSGELVFLAVAPDGDLVVVDSYQGWPSPITLLTKLAPDGGRRWRERLRPHPDDPSCCPELASRAALDAEGNIYLTIGMSLASVSADGELRWQRLLSEFAFHGCGFDPGDPPLVVDDRVWHLSSCGVFALTLEGEPIVWRPRVTEPDADIAAAELPPYFDSLALPDGTVTGQRTAGGVDVFDGTGELVRFMPWGVSVVGADGLFFSVGIGAVAHDGETELWRHFGGPTTAGPIVDSHGRLVVLGAGRHLNIYDPTDGAHVAALHTGREGFGPVGVSLREGELITQTILEMPDGRRIAALQCLAAPVSPAHPLTWSHRHGDQRLSRSVQSRRPLTDPTPTAPTPAPPGAE